MLGEINRIFLFRDQGLRHTFLKDGTLTSIQQKELKGFKYLKEYKFGRRGVRVIVNPGKKGEPDEIIKRDRVVRFIKSLRNKTKFTSRNKRRKNELCRAWCSDNHCDVIDQENHYRSSRSLLKAGR